jgi:hypothetical protein
MGSKTIRQSTSELLWPGGPRSAIFTSSFLFIKDAPSIYDDGIEQFTFQHSFSRDLAIDVGQTQKNQEVVLDVSAVEKVQRRDDLLKSQHDAEKSAFDRRLAP